jgi:hypothetical protein
MERTARWLAVATSLAFVLIVWALFPFRLFADAYLAGATLLLVVLANALALQVAVYVKSSGSDAPILGTIGLRFVLSTGSLLGAVAALIFAAVFAYQLSLVFGILAILAFVFSIGVSSIVGNLIGSANAKSSFSSALLIWADRLDSAAQRVRSDDAGEMLSEFAESVKYFSRDMDGQETRFDDEIERKIGELENADMALGRQELLVHIEALRKLFEQREVVLRQLRRKA